MLLTCAVTRAVHLELVPDMTTESSIRGFRRFMARRGVPTIIYSDNAKTFKRAAMELKELSQHLESEELKGLMREQRIEWRFIIERASWWGGWWERLVKTVKDAIKLTIGKAALNFEEMRTLLTEVEATVNSRPLTYIQGGCETLEILSPNNFLIGLPKSSLEITNDIQRKDILQIWRGREKFMKRFWKRWSTDYLQQLRSIHITSRSKSSDFKVGQVVLLYEQGTPRLLWKLARMEETYPGRDGRVRACLIRLSNHTTLRRPVQLLYPLEIEDSPFGPAEDVENSAEEGRTEVLPSNRETGSTARQVDQAASLSDQ